MGPTESRPEHGPKTGETDAATLAAPSQSGTQGTVPTEPPALQQNLPGNAQLEAEVTQRPPRSCSVWLKWLTTFGHQDYEDSDAESIAESEYSYVSSHFQHGSIRSQLLILRMSPLA